MTTSSRSTGPSRVRTGSGNDLLRLYLQDIGRVDLLTNEEEVLLARQVQQREILLAEDCLLYTSPSPRDATLSRMPSSA